MALGGVALMRMKKELDMLFKDPSPGISAWMKEDAASDLEAGAHEQALMHAHQADARTQCLACAYRLSVATQQLV